MQLTPAESISAARKIGLRYVADRIPGIARIKRGKHFSYVDARRQTVVSEEILHRIRSLVLPPAWANVWICPFDNGHLQATGMDARGRKQYRYHPDFRKHQDSTKFNNIVEFAQALPRIRRHVERDLNSAGLSRVKVIATVVRLLERTLIRVGNQEYAEHNHSFGLSTLQKQHVKHCGEGMRFTFMGKSGVQHDVEVSDHRLAKIVFRCHDLPGQHLFEFRDEHQKVHAINSSDVNDYIRDCAEADFSAKNFRTWKGTVLAAKAFERLNAPSKTSAGTRKMIATVVKDVSAELRNTPATCRKYYIHPRLIEAFEKGNFIKAIQRARMEAHQNTRRGLSHDEQTVLNFLKA